jgi:uncharacterized membrane protein
LIGYTVLFVLQTLTSRPYLTWRFPFRTLRNVIVASVIMGLATWGIYGMSADGSKGSPAYLLLSIVVGMLTYVICLWLTGEVQAEEKHAIQKLWYRVTREEAHAK